MGISAAKTGIHLWDTVFVPAPENIYVNDTTKTDSFNEIFNQGKLWGVFDFDSTKLANFDEIDKKYLTEIAKAIFA